MDETQDGPLGMASGQIFEPAVVFGDRRDPRGLPCIVCRRSNSIGLCRECGQPVCMTDSVVQNNRRICVADIAARQANRDAERARRLAEETASERQRLTEQERREAETRKRARANLRAMEAAADVRRDAANRRRKRFLRMVCLIPVSYLLVMISAWISHVWHLLK